MTHRLVRRSRTTAALVVAVPTVLGLLGGWLVEEVRGPSFTASTDVLVEFGQVQGFLLTGQSNGVTSQDVADAATLATSPDVLDAAAKRLDDGQDADDLSAVVTATPASISTGFTITATAPTAAAARRISSAVATATADVQQQRIATSARNLEGLADGDLKTTIGQRAEVLISSVQPVQVLRTASATQTRPTVTTALMLGVVGLAAGVLVVIGFVFLRPVVTLPRDAQRLTGLPSVLFDPAQGSAEATQLVRRLLDGRTGTVSLVPVDAEAEKSAQVFAEWARDRTEGPDEAARVVVTAEPVGAVLEPRPEPGAGAALVLVVPRGSATRTVTDAVELLGTWRAADAVVVTP